jgi:transcriptional regulator with XRE-family HTH domain
MNKTYDLRRRRKELGMTIEQVAERAGIAPASVRGMETGLFRGKLMTRQKIAEALEIPLPLLLSVNERLAVYGSREMVKKIEAILGQKERTGDEMWAELRRLGREKTDPPA